MQVVLWLALGLLWLTGALVLWFRVPPVPSVQQAIDEGLAVAQIKTGELVVDLGAGDGRVLQVAQNQYGARVEGWELHPVMWWLAKLRLRPNGKVHLANLWTAKIEDADLVFVFLMPKLMERVEREIWPRMKSGARLVSNSFPLPNERPVTQRGRAYLYIRPLQRG